MKRETPAATLFGALLTTVRLGGTGSSMRRVAQRIGTPTATVSQTEKGQRALKQPKIAAWADALEVRAEDLHELWQLSQGLVRIDGELAFYGDRQEPFAAIPPGPDIEQVLERRPELGPLYRLASLIADALSRTLGGAHVRVDPVGEHWEYPAYEPPLTDDERHWTEQWEERSDLPCLRCSAVAPPEDERISEFAEGELIEIPWIRDPSPIARPRTRSADTSDLDELIRSLTGAERERVRGYIEAIIGGRASDG